MTLKGSKQEINPFKTITETEKFKRNVQGPGKRDRDMTNLKTSSQGSVVELKGVQRWKGEKAE